MNKSLFMFLTLFSMVLMLAVYYVSLDHDEVQVVSVQSETSNELNHTSLQKAINQKIENQIAHYEELIASSNTKENEKTSALTKIEQLKQMKQTQDELVAYLEANKFHATIEIQDSLILITLFDQKEDQTIAKKVMDLIYEKSNGNFYLELSFK